MPLQDLTSPPTAPTRSMTNDEFIEAADAFVAWMGTFRSEMNTLSTQLEAAAALINAAPAYADAMLLAMADGNTPAADKLCYLTGASSSAVTDFTAVARTLVGQATQALMRTSGLGMSSDGSSLVAAADYSAMRTLLGLVIGTNVQAYDADLASIAALSTTSYGRSLLEAASASALRTLAGLVIGTDVQSPLTVTSNANGYAVGISIGGVTYYVQWGRISVGANTTATITFPVAFSDATSVTVVGSGVSSSATTTDTANYPGIKGSPTTTTATVHSADGNATNPFHWIAIGK